MGRLGKKFEGSLSRISVATTPAEVAALRDVWSSLSIDNLDADIDYFLASETARAGSSTPHVILAEREDRPPLLIVARRELFRFAVRVGYREVVGAAMPTIIVGFDGILGASDDADLRDCIRLLGRSLGDRAANAVLLQKLTRDGPVERAVHTVVPAARRFHGPSVNRWVATLPSSLDELLQRRSPNAPKEARYKERRLFRRYENAVRVERIDRASPEQMWTDVERVASRSYQRTLGVGARRTSAAEIVSLATVRHGWARVWMLYLAEQPAAYWWGNVYAGTFSVDTTGFDRDYAKDRVGTYVMNAMFDELCRDPDVVRIDFGHGDADYKKEFADDCIPQRDAVIVASRPGPLTKAAILSSAYGARSVIYRIARGSRLANRMRDARRSGTSATAGATDGGSQAAD